MSADISGLRMKAELNNLNNQLFCPGPHCAQGNSNPPCQTLIPKGTSLVLKRQSASTSRHTCHHDEVPNERQLPWAIPL